MRELVEQDAKEKHDRLRAEIEGMKYDCFCFRLSCSALSHRSMFCTVYEWSILNGILSSIIAIFLSFGIIFTLLFVSFRKVVEEYEKTLIQLSGTS